MKAKRVVLPDYSAAFRRSTVTPLRFTVRSGSNYPHDVQFLSSYLHDACVCPTDFRVRRRRLVLLVERDCWEFGYKEHPHFVELYTARSRVSIFPVTEVRWNVDEIDSLKESFLIGKIFIGSRHWTAQESSELVVLSANGRLEAKILIGTDFPRIEVEDTEDPHLRPEGKENIDRGQKKAKRGQSGVALI